jgi:TonB family protein
MRPAKLAPLFLALIPATTLAQQAAVTYKPAHPNDTSPPVACQASYPNQPQVDGIYRIEGDVKAPKLKHTVKAQLSQEARTRGAFTQFQATSTLAFVVDAQGVPQDVCILKPAGYGLDEEAAKAVRQYRFDPAKKDGAPVAVRVSMEVPFKTGGAN